MKSLLSILVATSMGIGALAEDVEIYVSDAGNFDEGPWQILKIVGADATPQMFTTQELAWPQDIVFLEDQNVVLISNLNSDRINRHDATTGDFIDVFADATHITAPTKMKIGPDGLLYVLQWTGDGVVKRFELDGTPAADFTRQGVSNSIGLDWDDAGSLYVASFDRASVTRFDATGEAHGAFVTTNVEGPTDIWFDESGDLLVSDWKGGSIVRFDASGTFKGSFIEGLSQSEGVDFLPNGTIVVGNGGTGSVKLYRSDGIFLRDLVAPGAGGLVRPNAITVRPIGD